MISRVADHCFWFGRYVERAESTARLLATTHNLALDAELEPAACWRPVLVVAGEEAAFRTRWGDDDDAFADGERVEQTLTWDDDTGASIRCSIGAARWNARSIREVVSLEAWESANELHLYLGSEQARADFADRRFDFYRRIRGSTQLVLGQLRSTMLHDDALDFIWLGVMLERVSQTARILDVHHHAITTGGRRHEVVATSLWLSLLRSLSGYEPFMKRHQGRVGSDAVVRFLIGEDRFPRSVAYCVHSAYERLCAIRPPGATELPGGQSLERLRILDELVRAQRRELHDGEDVHELLTTVVDETHAICDSLGKELLGHA
ncbi:MAG: alpha-E domain-containing protein [Kofleriaceae bacterium]|nr:MAG: alpha-E domain-containing protein [Kofleriaceae bacterium]MBZ0238717.1 alpha-E domain-containing protein [Kofleriaceae bacterium]